jgi:hypothetical protein
VPLLAPPIAISSAEEQRQFAQALRLYRSGRWAAAYGRFMVLADQGHARSARIALAMLRDGPSRYGSQWDAEEWQVQAWARAALRVDPVAAPLLVLNR